MFNLLREQIRRANHCRITYEEYMNTVLYHEQKGYYMKRERKLGKQGDFYTSVHVHDIFARMFVKIFVRFFEKTKLKPVICEMGGGDGKFAKAFLTYWNDNYAHKFSELTYILIEVSPHHRQIQFEMLQGFENVLIYSSLDEAKREHQRLNGVFFSNELFDALPVHVVEQREGELNEVFITINDDELTEIMEPCQRLEITNWVGNYFAPLKEGQRIEVPLAMEEVIHSCSEWFDNVCMFTVDYGYWKESWQESARKNGSLRGYYKHELIEDVLKYPGEMDITTHVQLDPFILIAQDMHLELLSSFDQNDFLLKAGILKELQENYDPNPFSETAKKNRAIRSFIMGEGFGSAFQVLVQKKGLIGLEMDDMLEKDSKYYL
ncbi:class I SAM-dependent methyltransferase [Bacillus solimangrovi]|uniref:SAM-dependent methyltransferase n=1 Tax=Bacillus solimangrovi TaxID=1305675 RepID=A0A1E5LFP8_9BACI|nr:SAM-dependent methyltransferase [Bacillus solimangrovi]OEH92890.1 hypothetical protein BFG57_14530 [Bacillus solimangrovi]